MSSKALGLIDELHCLIQSYDWIVQELIDALLHMASLEENYLVKHIISLCHWRMLNSEAYYLIVSYSRCMRSVSWVHIIWLSHIPGVVGADEIAWLSYFGKHERIIDGVYLESIIEVTRIYKGLLLCSESPLSTITIETKPLQ